MHINEVSKLKGFGNYQVDTRMFDLDKKLKEWIKEDGLELNPYFQRGHVWSNDQKIEFVEFILKGGTCPPLVFNHPGWLGSFEGKFYCVDGLQRISAILAFLNGELAVFKGHNRQDIEGIDKELKRIHVKIFINNLKNDREVLDWYLELNGGGTPHTQDELSRVKALRDKL